MNLQQLDEICAFTARSKSVEFFFGKSRCKYYNIRCSDFLCHLHHPFSLGQSISQEMSVHESLRCQHYPGRKMRDIGQNHSSALCSLPVGFMRRLIKQWFVFLNICQHSPILIYPWSLWFVWSSFILFPFIFFLSFFYFFFLLRIIKILKDRTMLPYSGEVKIIDFSPLLFTIKTWPDLGTGWDGTLGILLWNLCPYFWSFAFPNSYRVYYTI